MKHLRNETVTWMGTGWIYLKSSVESWQINRRCHPFSPWLSLWPLHTFPDSLGSFNRWDLLSLHRLAIPKQNQRSAFCFQRFRSLFFIYQSIPSATVSSYFLPRRNERINLPICFGQINLKVNNVLLFTKTVSKGYLGELIFSCCGSTPLYSTGAHPWPSNDNNSHLLSYLLTKIRRDCFTPISWWGNWA